MAFDPTAYQAPVAKPLPVVLLLDVSGSMYGENIEALYTATKEMIKTFADTQTRELQVYVSIITFGEKVTLHTPFTDAKTLENRGIEPFTALGLTPLGVALRMAKHMLEDPVATPSPCYVPAVILVSDGEPNGEWSEPLENFISHGKSGRTQRFALGIGPKAKYAVLTTFTGNPSMTFSADEADHIIDHFKTISMTVSTRAKSQNPNDLQIQSIQERNNINSVHNESLKSNTTSSKKQSISLDDLY